MKYVKNNCRACEYYELSPKEAGHCYMFKIEPIGVCAQFKCMSKAVEFEEPST